MGLSQVDMVPGEEGTLLLHSTLPTLEATVVLPPLLSRGDWSSEEGTIGEDRAETEERGH